MKVVSESGLYKLVLRSDKPDAKPFQDWVTQEVLPAIRKDGAYIDGEGKPTPVGAPPVRLPVRRTSRSLREFAMKYINLQWLNRRHKDNLGFLLHLMTKGGKKISSLSI